MSDKKKEEVVPVVRQGQKIIIPETMSYDTAKVWITRQQEAEEKQVGISHLINCYPLDGVIALHRAMEHVYGFTSVQGSGWFGSTPPHMVQVKLADGTYTSAVFGRITPPVWEGGYLEPDVRRSRDMTVLGQVKKKFEAEVRAIIDRTEVELKERSIYKGQAVRLDLSWIETGAFHPVNSAPKFIEGLAGVSESSIILSAETKFDVATSIYTLIEQSKACAKNKIPLRHGVLLAGTFGTGKTLLSRVIASKCPPNGWTFIYLEQAQHLAECLKLAEMYAPSVIFAEDIDRVAGEGRSESMNELLNTIDGMDTKGKPIITILTTNSPDKIEPAFMRAGRMDTVVHLGNPDAEAAQEFVKLYAVSEDKESLLETNCDLESVGVALQGTSPAFIAEAVHKAKRHAIYRTGKAEIVGHVTAEDLIGAAKAMQKHIAMAEQKTQKTHAEQVLDACSMVGKALSNGHGEIECPECGVIVR